MIFYFFVIYLYFVLIVNKVNKMMYVLMYNCLFGLNWRKCRGVYVIVREYNMGGLKEEKIYYKKFKRWKVEY